MAIFSKPADSNLAPNSQAPAHGAATSVAAGSAKPQTEAPSFITSFAPRPAPPAGTKESGNPGADAAPQAGDGGVLEVAGKGPESSNPEGEKGGGLNAAAETWQSAGAKVQDAGHRVVEATKAAHEAAWEKVQQPHSTQGNGGGAVGSNPDGAKLAPEGGVNGDTKAAKGDGQDAGGPAGNKPSADAGEGPNGVAGFVHRAAENAMWAGAQAYKAGQEASEAVKKYAVPAVQPGNAQNEAPAEQNAGGTGGSAGGPNDTGVKGSDVGKTDNNKDISAGVKENSGAEDRKKGIVSKIVEVAENNKHAVGIGKVKGVA